MDNYIIQKLEERYTYVKETLNEYREAIEKMTSVLLDVEVIEGTQVRSIIEEFEKENNMKSRLAHGDKIAAAKARAKAEEEAEEAEKNHED